MTDGSEHDIEALIAAMKRGDGAAREALFRAVYDRVKAIAAGALRARRPGDSLQPTVLAHEALERLLPERNLADRAHLLALAATATQQIIVDHARRRLAQKRGGAFERVTLASLPGTPSAAPVDALDIHEAIEELSRLDSRQAEIVRLRFFGALEGQEIATVLEISESTVDREWRAARAWLKVRLADRG